MRHSLHTDRHFKTALMPGFEQIIRQVSTYRIYNYPNRDKYAHSYNVLWWYTFQLNSRISMPDNRGSQKVTEDLQCSKWNCFPKTLHSTELGEPLGVSDLTLTSRFLHQTRTARLRPRAMFPYILVFMVKVMPHSYDIPAVRFVGRDSWT